MRAIVLFLSAITLSACTPSASSSSSSTAPSTETSGGGSTVADADASVAASPPTARSTSSDPGLACAGPYLRGAERGTRACRNAEGGWTQLICSRCTSSGAGVCSRPAAPNNVQVSASSAQGGGPNPTPPRDDPGGSCSPACCDNTLALMPEGVEDNFPTMP